MPRAVLEKTGLLDETLFMYAEDLDLCHRVRRAGFRVLFDASVSLVHLGGRSAGQVWSEAARLTRVRCGVHRMQRKHYGPLRADLGLFVRTLIGGVRGLSALRFASSDACRQAVLADTLANGRALTAALRSGGFAP
jgi:GT2 family glycosyltransferase